MDRTRPALAARLLAAGVAALLGSACTSALESDDDGGGGEIEGGDTLDRWPSIEVAGTATTPVADAEIAVHDVMRTPDGLTTLLLDVTNDGNDDTALGDLLGYTDSPAIGLYDPVANVEWAPLQIDDDIETGGCLCSSASVSVPAGETTTMYVTFRDVPADVESVRVSLPRFTPVADVPVLDAGAFVDGTDRPVPVEDDDDVTVSVRSVAPTDEGTLVRLRYTNESSAEPVPVSELPEAGEVTLVDADGSALFDARYDDSAYEDVAELASEDDLAQGDSVDAEVLVAGLPDDTDRVIVRGPRLRRSFPIPVADEPVTPDMDVPSTLAEQEIYELASQTARFDADAVPTAAPDEPPVGEPGPELPAPAVVQNLTSEAQPGWSVGVRAVVRGPGEFSTLLVDLTNAGGEGLWPDGLGANESAHDLGGVTVLDPANDRLYGVYQHDGTALSASDAVYPDEGETVRAYALLPALDEATRRVTVDVPTFGEAANVPVVDGPTAPAGAGGGDGSAGDVPASMRVRDDDRLRMDVLSVGRTPDGNGTLVRTRVVNESNPEAVATPFAGEGSESICDLRLDVPATGDVYPALDPCTATAWSDELAQGEGLVFEARFPVLPDDVEDVVVVGTGWFPSAPVAVGDDAEPWYLTLPAVAEEPNGYTAVAAEGTADGVETSTRTGDTVEVSLATDVLFATGSAELNGEAAARLADLAGVISDQAAAGAVTITGHTDDVGDDASNQTLSEQRAASVQAALEQAVGRPDLRFSTSGSGESDPVAPNAIDGRPNPDGQARNRRVTIEYEAS